MLGNTMQKAYSATSDAPVPTASTGRPDAGGHAYPDKLDAALLWIGAVCGLATILATLDTTVVAVAQRTFAAQFGSTLAIVSWTIAGYLLALATVIPITGWAADRYGTKRLFMGSVLLFTLASLLCALAPNILMLIVFRVLQGFGAGMLLPLSSIILIREAGPKRLGRLIAVGGIPLVHAYTVVFVLAVALVASTIIPAAFLPKKLADRTPTHTTNPVHPSNSIVAIRLTVSIGSVALT